MIDKKIIFDRVSFDFEVLQCAWYWKREIHFFLNGSEPVTMIHDDGRTDNVVS